MQQYILCNMVQVLDNHLSYSPAAKVKAYTKLQKNNFSRKCKVCKIVTIYVFYE